MEPLGNQEREPARQVDLLQQKLGLLFRGDETAPIREVTLYLDGSRQRPFTIAHSTEEGTYWLHVMLPGRRRRPLEDRLREGRFVSSELFAVSNAGATPTSEILDALVERHNEGIANRFNQYLNRSTTRPLSTWKLVGKVIKEFF